MIMQGVAVAEERRTPCLDVGHLMKRNRILLYVCGI